jgi:putative flippase GtrA
LKAKIKSALQFFKFCIVGLSNTIICEGIYVVLLFLGVHYLAANIIGNLISILNAYYWSNKYVFKAEEGEERVWWKVLLKTYATYGFSMLLSAGLLVFWLELVQLEQFMGPVLQLLGSIGILGLLSKCGILLEAKLLAEILAAMINLIITIPLNYVINKYWAYRKNK